LADIQALIRIDVDLKAPAVDHSQATRAASTTFRLNHALNSGDLGEATNPSAGFR
jgi:hypothetical protein